MDLTLLPTGYRVQVDGNLQESPLLDLGKLSSHSPESRFLNVSFLFKKTLRSSLPNKMEALWSEGHL